MIHANNKQYNLLIIINLPSNFLTLSCVSFPLILLYCSLALSSSVNNASKRFRAYYYSGVEPGRNSKSMLVVSMVIDVSLGTSGCGWFWVQCDKTVIIF